MIKNICKHIFKNEFMFFQNDPKMTPTWSQSNTQMKKQKTIPNVFQDESKVKPKSIQHESTLIPKPGPGRSDKGRKRVGLFLKSLLSLLVFCAGYLSYAPDTCLMCLILVLCVGYLSYVSDTCLMCLILVLCVWYLSYVSDTCLMCRILVLCAGVKV